MKRRLLRLLSLVLPLAFFPLVPALPAQAMRPDRAAVGEVPLQIQAAERVGRADPLHPMDRMVLVLPTKDPAGRERFLSALQTPGTPEYHRWLSPADYHARFGARREDVAAVTSWLLEQGFSVEPGDPGRTMILFSGNVAQVEAAFQTRIGLYAKDGEPEVANEAPATVPAPLARRAVRLGSLHGLARRQPLARVAPLYNVSGSSSHRLAPGDFATIYGLKGLYDAGINGSGRKIAIVTRTQIALSDVQAFRSAFGLPASDPQIVLNGADPGKNPDEMEADLDVEWSGGVAPGAQILLVISKSTATTDGVDLSARYIVDHDLADVMNISYGYCEAGMQLSDMQFYNDLFSQAVAQGITVLVASGDTGVTGCYGLPGLNSSWNTPSVNGLSSSPYATCVGGTMFKDQTSPSTYWAASNDSTTKASALTYIPEGAWSENSDKSPYGTGGGVSTFFTKPTWQDLPGVPSDGMRDVPDVSFPAAGHTAYLFYSQGAMVNNTAFGGVVLGTSFSAPAFAGVLALVGQATGGRLGNVNPTLYALARAQHVSGGTRVFHDVTLGNNNAPGVTGYAAGVGFDLSTGLGSLDGTVLAQAWPSMAPPANLDFLLEVSPGALAMPANGRSTVSVSLRTLTGADAIAALSLSGVPAAMTASFDPGPLSSLGSTGFASVGYPAALTFTGRTGLASGTYPITITAASGSVRRSLTIYVTVSSSTSVPPAPGTETQVPVVLDVFGANSSHYTSDFTAVNRSTTDATLQLRFTGGTATGPVISVSLPAGRQFHVPDVIAFIASRGYSFPDLKLGTLYVTFTGVSDRSLVFAGSRISTPNRDTSVGGTFGTFAAAVPSGTASSGDVWIYGLQKNPSFRSSVAVIHAPAGSASLAGGSPVSVEVQLYDGATGAAAGAPQVHTLAVGEFWQIDPFANASSTQNGYARVRRTSGTDRFITYGVVNDGGSSGGGTSDGSLIVSGGTDGVVPIVLDIPGSPHYQTEISLTNTSSSAVNVSLVYTTSPLWGGFVGNASVTIPAGQQLQQPNAISWLRTLGMQIPASGPQGGTLKVTGAVAVARTWQPASSGGGTYGVAYPALDASRRATTGAWVYGLRQDAEVRSNVAVADARVGDGSTRDYTVEIYDADAGGSSPVLTKTQTLSGGQWWQFNAILGEAGIAHGYARVRASSGSDFVAYGIVNDGPSSGTNTSDGSYVPMAVE